MLNFVVQFLDPEHRLALLTRIAQQMNPDGLLILSEKVRNADPLLQTFYDSTHLAWKLPTATANWRSARNGRRLKTSCGWKPARAMLNA